MVHNVTMDTVKVITSLVRGTSNVSVHSAMGLTPGSGGVGCATPA